MYSRSAPRRRHDAEFKAKVLADCDEPGASISGVALAHGLNANPAGAKLTIQGDVVTLNGTGTIALAPSSATFTMEVQNWNTPFGIQGLDIEDFGLQVGIKDSLATIGFLGAFVIGVLSSW